MNAQELESYLVCLLIEQSRIQDEIVRVCNEIGTLEIVPDDLDLLFIPVEGHA